MHNLIQPETSFKKAARLQDRAAKTVIWSAALLTMAILILIVGFIIVNGLYTRDERARTHLPVPARTVRLSDSGYELQLYVSRGIDVDVLEYGTLRKIFSGLTNYWGYISGQNRQIVPVIYSSGTFTSEVQEYLLNTELDFGSSVLLIDEPAELLEITEKNPGVILCFPGEPVAPGMKEALSGMKKAGILDLVLAVHPGVTELLDGQRLSSISWEEGEVELLLQGEKGTWKDVGGAGSSPVQVIGYSPGKHGAVFFNRLGIKLPESYIEVDTQDEAAEMLMRVRGGVTLVSQKKAMEYGLTTLEIESVRTSFNLTPSFILEPPSRAGAVGGISYIILNTLVMVLFVLLIATPVGVAGAVYLCEYAGDGRMVQILRIGIDTLAGIPSIIFGLFGYVFFAGYLGLKTGLLSGTFTLTIMILPTVIRTSEEAIRGVSQELRFGSLAVGATRHQTIWQIVIPAASPGILTGMILGIGRAIGETAALLFTMGSNLSLIKSLNSPMRVLSIHLYMLIRENISMPKAFATATILVIIVFLVNFATRRLIGRVHTGT